MTSNDRKSLLQRMDGLVGWTGIPRFARQETRMRRLKWTPILLLLFATAGLVLPIMFSHTVLWMTTFQTLWMTTFQTFPIVFGVMMAQLGPMRPKDPLLDADEREASWRTRSNLFAYGAVALVAWIGILATGIIVLWSDLVQRSVLPAHHIPGLLGYWLVAFACYLTVLFITLPTLHASWTMPEPIEDEPEPNDGGLRFIKPRRR